MTEPGKPLGMSDFFALEAGEYLERLDALLGTAEPAADEFVRLARALRGSALMAHQAAIARAAAGLEGVARVLREGRRAWDAHTKQLSVRALDDLKILVRHAASWAEADTAKAEALATELERAAGHSPPAARPAEVPGLDAGARAFVAREGAAIAGALDRAAQSFRVDPHAHDPLQHVLRALQPLRGLAALNDLPPLPDLLEGIERVIGDFGRPGFTPAVAAHDLFQAAAGAIARAAREVAEQGRPSPDAAEFRSFADLLMRLSATEEAAVPIATLYYGDTGPHIVRQGVAGPRPALGRLELVSQGEHLRQAADSLERAPSATQRELRAHTLAATFRGLAGAGGGPIAERLAEFAALARDVVASGAAVRIAPAFAAIIRQVGDLLARSGSGDESGLAAEFAPLITSVRALVAPAPAAPPAPVPAPPRIPAPPAVTRADAGIATVESPAPEPNGLIGSWTSYQRRVSGGIAPASIEELLRGSGRAPSLDTARPPGGEPPVVDIRSLLYRGARARERAAQLRTEAARASGDALRKLFDELYDLVAQAQEPDS
jgi:HPt (histidine-containing phosphotransfer) domain-containing protein